MLLRDGRTCMRSARSDRAALLVDMARYFEAAKAVMQRASRSIHFLNWAFEQDTFLIPGADCSGEEADRIGNFLKDLAKAKPELDIRILCWDSAMPVAATQRFFPFADRRAFAHSRVRFELDGKLPLGACHHQKMLIVDDRIAFCGGGDIGPDRWDTPQHLDDDPRREKTRRDHSDFDSRHEVMGIVEGEAALMLAEVFRQRWKRATGEDMQNAPPPATDLWPAAVTPDFIDITAGASRTMASWRGAPEVREVEALHVESIRAAERLIYMENQYFTSPLIAEALASRLRDSAGPEVVLVSTEHSPSYFDRATMDKTRFDFLRHLLAADAHGRFHVYSPVTTLGRTIIVHAKLTIIDDVLLRIGSANINNRSMGFDTECDLSLEATTEAHREAIAATRLHLLAHWLGCDPQIVRTALDAHGQAVIPTLEALRAGGYARLRPIRPGKMNAVSALVATYHLGDPVASADAWRPWKRGPSLRRTLSDFGLDPGQAKLVPEH